MAGIKNYGTATFSTRLALAAFAIATASGWLMLFAAVETWSIHLPRQAFLNAGSATLYDAVGFLLIFCIATIFKHLKAIGAIKLAGGGATIVASVILMIMTVTSAFAELSPLAVCLSGEMATCISNPKAET